MHGHGQKDILNPARLNISVKEIRQKLKSIEMHDPDKSHAHKL